MLFQHGLIQSKYLLCSDNTYYILYRPFQFNNSVLKSGLLRLRLYRNQYSSDTSQHTVTANRREGTYPQHVSKGCIL